MKIHKKARTQLKNQANQILARLTSILGVQSRYPISPGPDATKSIYKAVIPQFLYKPPFGYPRFVDIPEVRRLAATPFAEAPIRTIIDEIAEVDWNIVPEDKDKYGPSTEKNCDDVSEFFENPNVNKESFNAQIRKIAYDILQIDAGVWIKVFDFGGRMRELYVRDGGTFTKNPDIFGTFNLKADIIPPPWAVTFKDDKITDTETLQGIAEFAAYFQYGWITGARPMPFGKREVIYIMRNPRADSIYGRSVIEVCMDTIQTLVYGIDANLEYFTDNAIPKGVLGVEGADQEACDEISDKMKETMMTKNEVGDWRRRFYKMPVIGWKGQFIRLGFSNAELELIAQQEWFSKILWANLGVTPSELGFTADSNRATETGQSRVFRRKAIRPLLKLLEYHINSEIIPEFETGVVLHAGVKGKERVVRGITDVKFEFDTEDIPEETQQMELFQLQLRNGVMTKNEIREKLGLAPLEGGDQLSGTMDFNPFNKFGQGQGKEDNPPEEKPGRRAQDLDKQPAQPTVAKPATGQKSIESKPFGDYANFAECVRKNKDKRDPEAYCASVHKKVTGQWPGEKKDDMMAMAKSITMGVIEAMHHKGREEIFGAGASQDRLDRAERDKALTTAEPLFPKEFEEVDYRLLYKPLKGVLGDLKKGILAQLKIHAGGKDTLKEVKALDKEIIKEIKNMINIDLTGEEVERAVREAYYKALDKVGIELNRNFVPNIRSVTFLSEHAMDNVKDMADYLKSLVRKELEMGVMAGESITKLRQRIGKAFEMADTRAEMIARTEIIRAENTGLLEGYHQSGFKGEVEWVAHIDNRTCEFCKDLHGDTVEIGKAFKQNMKGKPWEGKSAPRHPRCRCRIVFHPASPKGEAE